MKPELFLQGVAPNVPPLSRPVLKSRGNINHPDEKRKSTCEYSSMNMKERVRKWCGLDTSNLENLHEMDKFIEKMQHSTLTRADPDGRPSTGSTGRRQSPQTRVPGACALSFRRTSREPAPCFGQTVGCSQGAGVGGIRKINQRTNR